jgi:transcriptional regulator with XRE-family HTH domain
MRIDPPYKPTFIRQWRKHRGLTLDQLVSRLDELAGNLKLAGASLSRIERGLQPYTQATLEAIADALACDPADLLMRDPTQDQMIWSLWDKLSDAKRRQAVKIMLALSEDDKAA